MLRCTLILALLGGLAACGEPETPQAALSAPWPTRVAGAVAVGVSFELPADWVEEGPGGDVRVFSGARGVPSWNTTITLQTLACRGHGLDAVLEASTAELARWRRFAWLYVEPAIVGGRPALRYAFQVEVNEQLQLRHGILVADGGRCVDLAYAAEREVFAGGVPVFEHAVDTILFDEVAPKRRGREPSP